MEPVHDIEELTANSKTVKAKSRIRTSKNDYLLIKVYGEVSFDEIIENDLSLVGLFWLYLPTQRDLYLIFGPTENKRFLKGDHQKIVSYYGTRHKKKARAYTLASKLEVLLVIHANLVKMASGEIPDDQELGLAVNKQKEGMIVTKKDLPTFAITFQEFLFGY